MIPCCRVHEKPSSPVWCSDKHQNHPKDVIEGRKRGLKFQAASQLACRLQDRRPGGSQLLNSCLASRHRPHSSTQLCGDPLRDASRRPFLGSMAAHTCASASRRHVLYPASPAVVLQCLVSTEALPFPWRHDIQHCCMAAASWVCTKGMMCLHPSLLRGLPDIWILVSGPIRRHPMSTQGCSVSVLIHCTNTWPCLVGFPLTM